MISVPRTAPAPEELATKGSEELDDYRGASAEARKKFKFKAYKVNPLVDELARMFHAKCAYCESRVLHVTSTDVEHWRPKGKILTDNGYVDGYWWLAAEWTNLFPACPNCNRPTKHTDAAGKIVAGKGMRFPLEMPRAAAPQEGDQETERVLLLNPSDPDPDRAPERHLEFATEAEIDSDGDLAGVIRAAPTPAGGDDPLGASSIDVFALNREALVSERRRVLEDIQLAIFNIRAAYKRLESLPAGSAGEADEVEVIRMNRAKLEGLLSDEAQYLLLARQFAAPFLASLPPS